jgi:hypothetical protein
MRRGAEVSQAVEWWRTQDDTATADVVLLTLTVRHRAGDDLKTLRQGVSAAWRRLQQTRDWREMRAASGLRHFVRCQEVTYGENGWHPHLHVLLFCTRPDVPLFWRDELTALWRHEVMHVLGEACLPSKARALDIAPCEDRTYLTRMGLEVGSPAAKHAREGHMSAMQLAAELARAPLGAERNRLHGLWVEYATAMHGAHQLQWSRGLRERLGVPESDFAIVTAPELPAKIVIAEIPRETWRDMATAQGLAPLDQIGRSKHGLPLQEQQAALLRFFQRIGPCRWKLLGGRLHLRWLQ